jgi:hypothetical protein
VTEINTLLTGPFDGLSEACRGDWCEECAYRDCECGCHRIEEARTDGR